MGSSAGDGSGQVSKSTGSSGQKGVVANFRVMRKQFVSAVLTNSKS
jgi:hypothetical protein